VKKNDVVRLSIGEINNLGCGVGHLPSSDGTRGPVVFVRDAVTGDEIEARIIKVNKSYLVARIERILTPSPLRCTPDCEAKGCGGCVYRHVSYAHELELKRDYVQNAFRKAGLSDVLVEDTRGTGVTVGYRNKAQYPVANGKNGMEAGFFATASHRIVPAESCKLQPAVFSEIAAFVCRFCDTHGIRAYEEESGKGLLRHIYLRRGEVTGEVMVCLVLNGETLPAEAEFTESLTAKFPAVKSVLINVNRANTNVVLGKEERLLWGSSYIEDELCGLRFRISAGAFYQVNHGACELLYGIAREKAALTGKETLLDLYCGIGSIGLSMAKDAGEVIGIEIVDEAVERAAENAERNGIAHAHFYCGDASDARKLLANAERERGALDVSNTTVVFDPPRKGSTPELIAYVAERGFPRVVYVSCNPDTLARDCVWFKELGYEIGAVTPVDMFPRTGHVESVVCLSRKTSHEMKLNSAPFEMIKSGEKTIELRLYDEKRQQIKVGDIITFTNTSNGEKMSATVKKLHRFDTFNELYQALPLLLCGYTPEDIDSAHPSDMEQYYSVEEQRKYGVVGIELCPPMQITDESVIGIEKR